MSGSTSPYIGNQRRIWDCLNAATGHERADYDTIGIEAAIGFEYWHYCSPKERIQCQNVDLDAQNITNWIERPVGCVATDGEVLRTKVLVVNQVIGDDGLRPTTEAAATRFSRSVLCEKWHLPAFVLEKLSERSSWHLDFSVPGMGSSYSGEAIATPSFSFVMIMDHLQNTKVALIAFFAAVSRKERVLLVRELNMLAAFSGEPAFMPYLVTSLSSRIELGLLDFHRQDARRSDLDLQRFGGQRESSNIFGAAHARASAVSTSDLDARNTLKLATRWHSQLRQRPQPCTDSDWQKVQTDRTDMVQAFEYWIQVLQDLVEQAQRAQQRTSRQLTTALSMLAYEQQKLSRQDQQYNIAIAEASKTIAEETKKDGSSMKTLALVTMCFLPATSVSSILAMPLFDWQSRGDKVVNPLVWVYFVLAIPLTLATVGIWYVWQRSVLKTRTAASVNKC